MAAASTTRPASCPPISRGSSGRVSPADVALILRARLAEGAAAALVLGCGDTVGNSPPGLVPVFTGAAGTVGRTGRVPVPGSEPTGGGLVPGSGTGTAVIFTVADPLNGRACLAWAFALRVRLLPVVADLLTGTLTWSSSAWPCGRSPSAQVLPWPAGHTEKWAVPAPLTCRTKASTVTCFELARALHTQMV
jgi:hypothetical protein